MLSCVIMHVPHTNERKFYAQIVLVVVYTVAFAWLFILKDDASWFWSTLWPLTAWLMFTLKDDVGCKVPLPAPQWSAKGGGWRISNSPHTLVWIGFIIKTFQRLDQALKSMNKQETLQSAAQIYSTAMGIAAVKKERALHHTNDTILPNARCIYTNSANKQSSHCTCQNWVRDRHFRYVTLELHMANTVTGQHWTIQRESVFTFSDNEQIPLQHILSSLGSVKPYSFF